MFLLTEQENNIEVLTEDTSSGKKLYLEGVFAQSEKKNRNGRIYPKSIMEKAVDAYQQQYIAERRSIGELNHPEKRPFADPKEAALMVESLSWQGNDVVGKALVLNTPNGNIIKALLEANFKLGVSTRGLGELKEQKGQKFVSSYMLNAIDAVDMPSGQDCYPNALMESVQWILESGIWVQKAVDAPGTKVSKKLDEAAFLGSLEKMFEYLKSK